MPPVVRILLLFVVAAAVYGCTDIGERGFKTSEPHVMAELEVALAKEGVPFRRDADGFIRYGAENDAIVQRLHDEVQRKLSGGVAVKYDDEVSREFMKGLLASRGIEFRLEDRNDGEWIRWYPANEAQKQEIEMKVVEHYFDQRQKMPADCTPQKPPADPSLDRGAAQARRAC